MRTIDKYGQASGIDSWGPAGQVAFFSARWTADVEMQQGPNTFTFTGDDGYRLWVDNVLVLDKWLVQGSTVSTGEYQAATASIHRVTIEYFQHSWESEARLTSMPTGAQIVVGGAMGPLPGQAPVSVSQYIASDYAAYGVGGSGPMDSLLFGPSAFAMSGDTAYVADSTLNQIFKITPGSPTVAIAGWNSQSGPSTTTPTTPALVSAAMGDGGPATMALIHNPEGVAVDTAGNVYIADTGHHRIRKVDASNDLITSIAGIGLPGSAADNVAAVTAQISSPKDLAYDADSNDLVFIDSGNAMVRRIDLDTGLMTIVMGGGTLPGVELANANSWALLVPTDVWVQNSWIFVADSGLGRIFVINTLMSTNPVHTLAGGGSGNVDGTLGIQQSLSPQAVAGTWHGEMVTMDGGLFRVEPLGSETMWKRAGGGSAGANGGDANLISLDSSVDMFSSYLPGSPSLGPVYVMQSGPFRIRKLEKLFGPAN
jgi:PA14 domain/NHL repeat